MDLNPPPLLKWDGHDTKGATLFDCKLVHDCKYDTAAISHFDLEMV